MPILRLNAQPSGLALHGSPASALRAVRSAAHGTGPVIILIHGFKYDPDSSAHCPHSSIFAGTARPVMGPHIQWLHHMGFGAGDPDEGLAIPFAWQARGSLWQAQRAARDAGRALATLIETLHACASRRPIHVVTHSMGSEVIFEALHSLPSGRIDRIVTLTAASYATRAARALLDTAAGRSATLFNVTTRENDPFDFMYERLIKPPVPGDRAMGRGVALPNAVTLQLDCARTLMQIARFGGHIAASTRRVCHWSGYTRPGALQFYAHALRNPEAVPLDALRQALPLGSSRPWSRMFAKPRLHPPLPTARKPAS